jgi:hypothetical protein
VGFPLQQKTSMSQNRIFNELLGSSGGATQCTSGRHGAKYRSLNHPSCVGFIQIVQQYFEFSWVRLFQERGSSRPPPPKFTIFRSAEQRFLLDPPCSGASLEVNPEPHTGARPSVRLCVGLVKHESKICINTRRQETKPGQGSACGNKTLGISSSSRTLRNGQRVCFENE